MEREIIKVVKELTLDGYEFRLTTNYDEFSWSPREGDCNFGKLVCHTRNYDLSDVEINSGSDVWREMLRDIDPKHRGAMLDGELCSDFDDSKENRNAILIRMNKHFLILPVYMYDHGGIDLSTSGFSCRWDSRQIGFIYISRKAVRENYGVRAINAQLRDKVLGFLTQEVKTYSQYINNEAYAWTMEAKVTGEWEHEDSSGSHYSEAEAEEDGLSSFDYQCKAFVKRAKADAEQAMMPIITDVSPHGDPANLY